MVNLLAEKLQAVIKKMRGYGKLTESNVAEAVRDVRMALLAADVNYQIAGEFCTRVKERCLGQEVLASIRPGDQFIKIVHDELIARFGEGNRELSSERPLRLLLCGLNGSGKTTTAAKLAAWFRKDRADVALVAGDLARPAAIQQLQVLGKQIQVPVLVFPDEKDPAQVARLARAEAERLHIHALIFDAAGRLDADEELLAELACVAKALEPQETLLVADAATGQSAVKVAKAFQERVSLTGVVLSKFDADTRGGAALSILEATGCPLKFLGTGEKTDALEFFMPERLVGRLLGMGDIIGLVEKAQEEFDVASAARIEERVRKNQLNLQDFVDQMKMLKKLGPMQNIIGMMPGLSHIDTTQFDDKKLRRVEAIILSMTPGERKQPDILNARRRQRIARGSGTSVSEVNDLLRRFEEMKKMFQRFSRGGSPEKLLQRMMRGR